MNTLKESCHTKINLLHVPTDTAKALYYYVRWTGHFVCKEDFYISRANFNCYLMIYTVKGSGTLNYEGRSHVMNAGSLMLIDCNIPQEYYPNADGWEFKYIHFDGPIRQIYDYIQSINSSPVILGGNDCEKYFDKVAFSVKNSESEVICSRYIYRILTDAIDINTEGQPDEQSAIRIRTAIDYIADNYGSNIDVSILSGLTHLSRCYFSTEFKKATGLSPYAYILSYRLESAKRMLINSSKSIETIAERCGFSDTSSFIRAFKRTEAITPSEYRKCHSK